MAKKKKKTAYKEKTLAMKDAENLTVEQVSAKSDELETENLTKESSLDKYIRQHRSDIESAKKVRQLKAAAASESLDKLVKTAREAATADSDDSEKEISSEKEDVVENKTTLSDTAVEEVSVQSETVSEIAPVSEPEIPEVTEPVEEAIEPDFPEIQGSFDTVVLAADDDDEQSPGSPALSEKSDEPVSQVDPDPVVTPFASKVSEPTTTVKTPVKVPEMIAPQPASAKQEWSIGASEQETKSHKKPLIIGVCALLLLAVGGTVWYQVDQSNQKQAAQTAKSEAKKSEEAKKNSCF